MSGNNIEGAEAILDYSVKRVVLDLNQVYNVNHINKNIKEISMRNTNV